jgi:hypothetical protein
VVAIWRLTDIAGVVYILVQNYHYLTKVYKLNIFVCSCRVMVHVRRPRAPVLEPVVRVGTDFAHLQEQRRAILRY